jgi:hypothetical protein
MVEFKELSENEVREISEKFEIDSEIINEIVDLWYEVLNEPYYYPEDIESIKKFRKREENISNLFQFYNDHKKEIEERDAKFFDHVIFVPTKYPRIKLPGLDAKELFLKFIEIQRDRMREANKIFLGLEALPSFPRQKHRHEKILDKNTKERNILIEAAFHLLWGNKIKNYAPIIKELLSKMAVAEIPVGTIRQIIHRLKV